MGLIANLKFENGIYRCGKCLMRQPLIDNVPPSSCLFCGSQFTNWENLLNEVWRLQHDPINISVDNDDNGNEKIHP